MQHSQSASTGRPPASSLPSYYRIQLLSLSNLPEPAGFPSHEYYQLAIGSKSQDLYITNQVQAQKLREKQEDVYGISFNEHEDVIIELNHPSPSEQQNADWQYMYFSIYINGQRENRVKLQVDKYVNANKMRSIEFVLLIKGMHSKLKLRMMREENEEKLMQLALDMRKKRSHGSGSSSPRAQEHPRNHEQSHHPPSRHQIGASSPVELEQQYRTAASTAPSDNPYQTTGELYNRKTAASPPYSSSPHSAPTTADTQSWKNDSDIVGLSTIKAAPQPQHQTSTSTQASRFQNDFSQMSDVDSLLKHASRMLDLGSEHFSSPLDFSPQSSPSSSPKRRQSPQQRSPMRKLSSPSGSPSRVNRRSPRRSSSSDRKALIECIHKQRSLIKQMEMDHVKIVQTKDRELSKLEQKLRHNITSRKHSPLSRGRSPRKTSSPRSSRGSSPARSPSSSPRGTRRSTTSRNRNVPSQKKAAPLSNAPLNSSITSMAEYQAVIDMCNQLEKEKQQLSRQASKFKSQCHQYQTQIKEQQEQIRSTSDLNDNLRAKIKHLEERNVQLRETSEHDDHQLERFQQQLMDLSQKYNKMRESHAQERAQLTKEHERVVTERSILQTQLDRLIEKMSDMKEESSTKSLSTGKDYNQDKNLGNEDHVRKLKQDCEDLKRELEDTSKTNDRLVAERDVIERTARALKLEKEMMQKKMKEIQGRVVSQITNMESEWKSRQKMLDDYKSKIQQLQKDNDSLRAQLQESGSDGSTPNEHHASNDSSSGKQSLQKRIQQLEEENYSLRNQTSNLSENLSVGTLDRHLEKLHSEKQTVEEEIRLLTQLSSNDEAIETLQEKTRSAIRELNSQIDGMPDDTVSLISHLMDLSDKQKQIYDESIHELKRRLARVLEKSKHEQTDLEETISNMEEQLNKREEEISDVQARNLAYSKEIDSLRESMSTNKQELSDKNSSLSKKVYDLEREVSQYQTKLEKKDKLLATLADQRRSLQKQVDAIKQKSERSTDNDSNSSSAAASYAYQELRDTQNKLRQLERDHQFLKEKNSSLMRQCKELTVTNVNLSDQLERLKQEHKRCDEEILEYKHRVEDFQSENDRLQHNLEARDSEVEDLLEVVENVKARIKILQDSNDALQEEVVQLNEENHQLTNGHPHKNRSDSPLSKNPDNADQNAESTVDQMSTDSTRLLDTIEALTSDKQQLQAEMNALKTKYEKELKRQQLTLTKERDQLKQELTHVNFEQDKLNHQLASQRHDHDKVIQEEVEKKTSEYRKKVSDLEGRILKYQELLADMESKLKEPQQQSAEQQSDSSSTHHMELSLEKYERMKASYEEEINVLQDQLADLEQNHEDEMELCRNELQAEIDEKDELIRRLKQQAHAHDTDAPPNTDEFQQKCEELRELLQSRDAELSSLQKEQEQLKKKLHSMERSLRFLEEEKQELLSQHARELQQLNLSAASSSSSLADASKIEELNKLVLQKNGLIQKFEKKIRHLKVENEELIDELAKMDDQLAKAGSSEEINQLKEDLDEHKNLLEQCQADLDALTLSSSRTVAEKDALEARLKSYNQDYDKMQTELEQRDSDIDSLLSKVSEYEQQLEEKDQLLAQLQTSSQQREGEHSDQQSIISRMQRDHAAQISEMEDFFSQLKDQVSTLKRANHEKEVALERAQSELSDKNQLLEQLENQSQNSSSASTTLEFKLTLLEQKLSEKNSLLNTQKAKITNLKRELKERDEALSQLRTQNDITQQQLTETQKELEDRKTRLKITPSQIFDDNSEELIQNTEEYLSDEDDVPTPFDNAVGSGSAKNSPSILGTIFHSSSAKSLVPPAEEESPLVVKPEVPLREPTGLTQTTEKISRILHEFISTEQTYVYYLQILDAYFMKPLKEQSILPEKEHKQLFLHVDSVTMVNTMFLDKISEHLINEGSEEHPSFSVQSFHDFVTSILGFFQSFKLYTAYIQNYSSSIALLSQLRKKSEKLDSFLVKQSNRLKKEGCRIVSIQSLMITPVQRIPRYRLLLADLKKRTDEEELLQKLERAYDSIEFIAQFCENKQAEGANSTRFLEVCQQSSMQHLIEPGRKLVCEFRNSEYFVSKSNVWKNAETLLCNDLVLVRMLLKKKKYENVVISLSEFGEVSQEKNSNGEDSSLEVTLCNEDSDGSSKSDVHRIRFKNAEDRRKFISHMKRIREQLQKYTKAH